MRLPDKVYEFLKWLLIIVVPAFLTLFTLLAQTWHWNIPVDAIVTTITGICTFIGICIGISSVQYNKEVNSQKYGPKTLDEVEPDENE